MPNAHRLTKRMCEMFVVISLLGSSCLNAADKYTQYITNIDCDSEYMPREYDVNKIYEPAQGFGIERLFYALDKVVIDGAIKSQSVQDKNGRVLWKPAVALRLHNGWLAGSFSTVYGGELVFIDETMKATLLIGGAVVDIFETSFGFVVVTRSSLVGGGGDNIYLLSKLSGVFRAKKLFTLVDSPLGAKKLKNGSILIKMKNASFIFTSGAELYRVRCKNTEDQGLLK